MKTQKSFQIIGLLGLMMFFCLSTGKLMAQEKKINVKAGGFYQSWHGKQPMLALESQLCGRYTWQVELAAWRKAHLSGYPSVYSAVHAGLSVRSYLLLRQGKSFCGFYMDPFASFDWGRRNYKESEGLRTLGYSTSVGMGIGFQQVLFRSWTLDAGWKMAWHPNYRLEEWFSRDYRYRKVNLGSGFFNYMHLTIGHTF